MPLHSALQGMERMKCDTADDAIPRHCKPQEVSPTTLKLTRISVHRAGY